MSPRIWWLRRSQLLRVVPCSKASQQIVFDLNAGTGSGPVIKVAAVGGQALAGQFLAVYGGVNTGNANDGNKVRS